MPLIPHWAVLLSLPTLLGLSVAPAKSADPIEELLSALHQDRHQMRAALSLWSLEETLGYTTSKQRQRILGQLENLTADKLTPVPVRRLAWRMLAERFRALGEEEKAKAAWDQLGPIRDWWVIGPFPNDGNEGFDTPYGPEEDIQLDATTPGKNHPVAWRPFPAAPANGRILLHPTLSPRENAVAYALALFQVDRPLPVLVWVGSDDGCRIWINNQEILSDRGPHLLKEDQRAISLMLSPGLNRVLMKVAQTDGTWGFSLSITDPTGQPLKSLRPVFERDHLLEALAKPFAAPPRSVQFHETLASWFEARLNRAPKNPRFLSELAVALNKTSASDQRENRPKRLLKEAIDALSQKDPAGFDLRLVLSSMASDDNETRTWLEEANKFFPNRPEAWSRLGLLYHLRASTPLALYSHFQALCAQPDYLPSLLEKAELFAELSLGSLARSQLDQMMKLHPDLPEVLSSAIRIYRGLGFREEVERFSSQLLAQDRSDTLALRSLYDRSIEKGDIRSSLARLEQMLALEPLRTIWWMERGDLLLKNGLADSALESFRHAFSICPFEPAALVRESVALLTLGRTSDAMDVLQQALLLSPEDHDLERHLRFMQPRSEAFYQPYEINPSTLLSFRSFDPLTTSAGSIRLLDSTVVRLYQNGMVSRYHQEILRIQNQQGAKTQQFARIEYVPGRQEVRLLQSRVFHSNGSVDTGATMEDRSLSEPWYNLYYDVHAQWITFPTLRPGDTIELTYLVEDVGHQNLLSEYFGDLVPLQFEQPSQKSIYVLLTPAGKPIYFNQPSNVEHRTFVREPETVVHVWEVKEVPAVEPEPNMPGFTETNLFLHVSTFKDWNALGRWFGHLIQDSLSPSPEIRQQALELTQGLKNPMDKIRAVYRFVADQTRYVGLEFGIHNYVPYSISQVLYRKFGDCKDKSALLIGLLREIGISAQMALVRMNRLGRISNDGPASLAVFNHAVCYLPEQNLWLDGTASFYDLEDLPPQDQDTLSLILDENGSRLTNTPSTSPQRNLTEILFEIKPQVDGSSMVAAEFRMHGLSAPEMRARFLSQNTPDKLFEKTIYELYPGAKVSAVEFNHLDDPEKPLVVHARFEVPNLGKTSESGLDAPALGRDTSYQQMLSPLYQRRNGLQLGSPWTVQWKVRWILPTCLHLPSAPLAQRIDSPMGSVELSFSSETQGIAVSAEFTLIRNRVHADEYPTFRDFLGNADRLLKQHLRFPGDCYARS
jgi:cellulose synthase operon protein C